MLYEIVGRMETPNILRGRKLAPHQFNAVIGYFYNLNFIVGTGFLGIPFTFYHAGVIPSIATLTILSVCGCITALWMLEILARARVLNKLRSGSEGEDLLNDNSENNTAIQENIYFISSERKFEMTELCRMMFGKAAQIIFAILLLIYSSLWSSVTIVGTSWSTNIPVNASVIAQCHERDFTMQYFPADTRCYHWYQVCVSVFGVIVVLLSLLELNEQKYIQTIFSILRFIALISIISFSTYIIIHNSLSTNTSLLPEVKYTNTTSTLLLSRFNMKWWIVTLPVLIYAQSLHQGIPSFAHPVVPKKHLKAMLIATFVTTWSFYTLIGILVSFAFLSLTNENAALGWNYFTGANSNIAVRIVSYFIILFPTLDTISAYPLGVIINSNNIYSVLMCRDTSEAMKTWKDRIGKLLFRFVIAVTPLIGAIFISNLVTVLKFAGLFAFLILFIFPILFQFQSKRLCIQKLENSEYVSTIFENHDVSVGTESHISDQPVSPRRHKSPSHRRTAFNNQFLKFLFDVEARTPYSGWYSNNLVLIIISFVALICIGLAIMSVILPFL